MTCWAHNLKIIVSWEVFPTRSHRVRKVTLALMLSYHQIDCFLGIVQIEFVVLLFVYIFAVVIEIFTI